MKHVLLVFLLLIAVVTATASAQEASNGGQDVEVVSSLEIVAGTDNADTVSLPFPLIATQRMEVSVSPVDLVDDWIVIQDVGVDIWYGWYGEDAKTHSSSSDAKTQYDNAYSVNQNIGYEVMVNQNIGFGYTGVTADDMT